MTDRNELVARLRAFLTVWGDLPSIPPHIKEAPGFTTGTVIGVCEEAADRIEADAATIARLESALQSATAPHTDRITMGRAATAGRIKMLEDTIARLEGERDDLAAGDAENTRLMLGAQKRMRDYKARAEAAEAKLARAVDGLRRIGERPSQMTWGEDHEVREAMDQMSTIARAIIAEIEGASRNPDSGRPE